LGLGRWFAAHGQAVVIAGLVVVTTLATGLVIAGGTRQLDIGPGQRTTPYLAARPSGPVRVPVGGVGRVGGSTSPTEADTPRGPEAGHPRPARPPLERGMPPKPKLPEVTTPPGSPESSQPPTAAPPRLPGRRCRVKVASLGQCVLRMPSPPKPPRLRQPGGRSSGGWSSFAVPLRNS
jgi:hypothetical protein